MVDIIIELTSGTEREIATKEQLLALLKKYDLRKWFFTKHIRIDETAAISYSHPVLTLNTRPRPEPVLLATFIHEQLHWFVSERFPQAKAAMTELRTLHPQVPVGRPQGARDAHSTYLPLIICYLEYRALAELLGEDEATKVLATLPYYQWIYRTVRTDAARIGDIIERYKLVP